MTTTRRAAAHRNITATMAGNERMLRAMARQTAREACEDLGALGANDVQYRVIEPAEVDGKPLVIEFEGVQLPTNPVLVVEFDAVIPDGGDEWLCTNVFAGGPCSPESPRHNSLCGWVSR